MNTACYLHLVNGWTVSVSMQEVPPATCNVRAWPSHQDGLLQPLTWESITWFVFSNKHDEMRCYSLEDVRKALMEVEYAAAPL